MVTPPPMTSKDAISGGISPTTVIGGRHDAAQPIALAAPGGAPVNHVTAERSNYGHGGLDSELLNQQLVLNTLLEAAQLHMAGGGDGDVARAAYIDELMALMPRSQ